jgi:hypothetical protein
MDVTTSYMRAALDLDSRRTAVETTDKLAFSEGGGHGCGLDMYTERGNGVGRALLRRGYLRSDE